MEQLYGESCFLCFVLNTLTHQRWIDHLKRGSGKKRFQYCLDCNGYSLYMRAIQGHSGGNKVDPPLQENVEIPYSWIKYIYHAGASHDCNSIIQSRLIAGGKDTKEGRQTVFFTAVDLMNEPQEDEFDDVTKPRLVPLQNLMESAPERRISDKFEKVLTTKD